MDSEISEAGIPKTQIKIPQKVTAVHSALKQTNKQNKNPHTVRTLEKQPQGYITHTQFTLSAETFYFKQLCLPIRDREDFLL